MHPYSHFLLKSIKIVVEKEKNICLNYISSKICFFYEIQLS